MKKLFRLLIIFLTALAAILLFNTFTFKSKQIVTANGIAVSQPQDEQAVKHLSDAIRIQTISYDDTLHGNYEANLDTMVLFLKKTYPLVFSSLQDTVFPGHSILLKWQGANATLDPAIFYAHMDVVPIEESSLSEWQHAPFSGDVADDFI